ncbi:unnamed protein product [Cylicocyclus nassatus]|uniref:Metalloendopeptidase n=1 Tax=Cylicocyclus nassatus TaxID=53992 RepID=A0AA36M3D2_CYLNA|nr:unnamed protein product [Cylicocyclus nassatus]
MVIDIANQDGGDIADLWEVAQYNWNEDEEFIQFSEDFSNNGTWYIRKLYNAVGFNSKKKWRYRDRQGHVIIPFVIKGPYKKWQKKRIRKAMNRIEANTCIRFRRKTRKQKDHIVIRNRFNAGCYSTVGRPGGASLLSLEANHKRTCMTDYIVLHELLHVVGLWHEHQRADRDRFIKVVRKNVAKGMKLQFKKVKPPQAYTYNVQYDYMSIMHYNKHTFAIGKRITMRTRDPRYQNLIGKVNDASPSDYLKVCRMYGCKGCEAFQLTRFKPPRYIMG